MTEIKPRRASTDVCLSKGKNWYIDFYVQGRRKRRTTGTSRKLAQQVLSDVNVKMAKEEFLGIYEQKKLLFEQFASDAEKKSRRRPVFVTPCR